MSHMSCHKQIDMLKISFSNKILLRFLLVSDGWCRVLLKFHLKGSPRTECIPDSVYSVFVCLQKLAAWFDDGVPANSPTAQDLCQISPLLPMARLISFAPCLRLRGERRRRRAESSFRRRGPGRVSPAKRIVWFDRGRTLDATESTVA